MIIYIKSESRVFTRRYSNEMGRIQREGMRVKKHSVLTGVRIESD